MTPGVVSPIVSPRVLGTSPGFIGTPFVSRPIGGIQAPVNFRYSRVLTGRDIDPITPGIQTRPGIITATGPSIRRFWFVWIVIILSATFDFIKLLLSLNIIKNL